MKYLKKTLSFVLAFAMTFTMVIVPRGSVSAAGDSSTGTSGYTYFDTTMFKYDNDTFNKATYDAEGTSHTRQGIYFNEGNPTTSIKTETNSHTNVKNENYNTWTGKWDANKNTTYGQESNGTYKDVTDRYYICPGIVKSDLDENGQIQFNYPQAGIFDTSKTTGKSTYTNVKMPFKKDSNGYYYYDSNEYDVKFPNNNAASDVKLLNEGLSKISGKDKGSFLPFSQNSSGINTEKNAGFHFGMNMSVKFYMPENGKINGKDMKFEFSGDDDVWVFVDGKLVLDIGGIHDAIAGDINFATGVSTVYQGQEVSDTTIGTTSDENIVTNIYTSDVLGTNWKNQTNKVHTLQVFYLERGKGESNCKIKLNLDIPSQLEVTKSLGNQAKDDEDLKALLTQKFNFEIYSSADKTDYKAYANKEYYIYTNGSQTGTGTTGDDGSFTLGFNETALFVSDDFSEGKTFKVKEIVPKGANYSSTWKTSRVVPGDKTEESSGVNGGKDAIITTHNGSLTEPANYEFVFINTFNASLNDDVVVLDYGKPVEIDVLANDILYGSTRKIKELTENKCENGTLELIDNNAKLKYTPTRYMNSIDTAKYSVYLDKGTKKTETANVSIMPATSVYYEDDFVTENKGDSTVSIVWSDGWTTDGNKIDTDRKQSSENTRYGWEKTYSEDTTYSGGSAHKTDGTRLATATFTFKGTGVDVYSRTNGNVGLITARIYEGVGDKDKDGNYKKAVSIKYIDNISKSGDYYQVPTLSFDKIDGLEYGTYTVVLTAGMNGSSGKATYYLDGIRVYNPLKDNATAEKAYKDAGEANATYIKLRDTLLSAGFGKDDENKDGSVFIDEMGKDIGVKVGDKEKFEKLGPKNEVYLAPGQAVAFEIENYNPKTMNVFAGLKALSGTAVNSTRTYGDGNIKEETIKSSNDLYYQIIPTSSGRVVIKNNSTVEKESDKTSKILAITKIRVTNKNVSTQSQEVKLVATQGLLSYAEEFSSLPKIEDSSDSSGDNLGKDDVDIDNPSDNDKDDDNSQTNNSIWNKILNYIKHWFRK